MFTMPNRLINLVRCTTEAIAEGCLYAVRAFSKRD